MSCDKCAPVLLNSLNSLRRENLYFLTHLINSIKHEHSCKVLYILSLVYMHNIHPSANIHPGSKFAPGVYFGHVNSVL